MAKSKNQIKKPVQTKAKSSTKVETKEPSKGEIIFFRIGMSIILLAIVAFVAVLVINKLSQKTNPYEDYVTITEAELAEIVADNGVGETPGNITYFNGIDEYADLQKLLVRNDVVYFYFYRSSAIDEDIQKAIEALTDVNGIPTYTLISDNENEAFLAFLFIDLDAEENSAILENTDILAMGLQDGKDNMLVRFDYYPSDSSEYFTYFNNSEDIVDEIDSLA